MKNTTKLFAAAVVAMSFAARAELFDERTLPVFGAIAGGVAGGVVIEEQFSNASTNWNNATKSQKVGYAAVGLGLSAVTLYALNTAFCGFIKPDASEVALTRAAAIALAAGVTTFVMQQKGRSEKEQQAVYAAAGHGFDTAQAHIAAKANVNAAQAKPAASKAPAKK